MSECNQETPATTTVSTYTTTITLPQTVHTTSTTDSANQATKKPFTSSVNEISMVPELITTVGLASERLETTKTSTSMRNVPDKTSARPTILTHESTIVMPTTTMGEPLKRTSHEAITVIQPMTTTGQDSVTSITAEIMQSTSISNSPDTTENQKSTNLMPITTTSAQTTANKPSTSTVHETRTASELVTSTGLATSTAPETKMQTSIRHSPDITTGKSKPTTAQESITAFSQSTAAVPITTGELLTFPVHKTTTVTEPLTTTVQKTGRPADTTMESTSVINGRGTTSDPLVHETTTVKPPVTTTGQETSTAAEITMQSTSISNPPDRTTEKSKPTTTTTQESTTVSLKTTAAAPRTTGELLTFSIHKTSPVTEPITNTRMAMQSTSMRISPDKTSVTKMTHESTIVMLETSEFDGETSKLTTHETTTGTPTMITAGQAQTATVTDPATTDELTDTPVVMLLKTSEGPVTSSVTTVEQTTATHFITTTLAPLDLDPPTENEGYIYLNFRIRLDFIQDYYYKTTYKYKELERDVITEVMHITLHPVSK